MNADLEIARTATEVIPARHPLQTVWCRPLQAEGDA